MVLLVMQLRDEVLAGGYSLTLHEVRRCEVQLTEVGRMEIKCSLFDSFVGLARDRGSIACFV